MFMLTNPDAEIVYANDSFLKAIPANITDLQGRLFYQLFEPADEGTVRQSFLSAIEGKNFSTPVLVRLRRQQDYLAVSLFPVPDESGQITHIAVEAHWKELSEANREELAENLFNFQILADHIAQLAWMADAKGWIYWYNKRWFQYTGTTLEEMQGWGWRKVHHPDHVDRVVSRIQHSWDTGEFWEDIFPLRSAGGEYRWFLSRAHPIRNTAGEIIRWFGTNTDITEHQLAEQALMDASLRKDEFLAILGHELRNPIAALLSAIDEMPDIHSEKERQHQQEIMQRQVARLKRLVDDLVDVSRLTRGKIMLQQEPVDFNEQLQVCLDTLRKRAGEKNQVMATDLCPAPLPLMADPVRLQQILINIIHNAIKYTPEGGKIRISSLRKGKELVFTCADTGQGIPPDKLNFVFDPFTQLNVTMDRTNTGLGIGLSLVKQLTELHQGVVEVTSEGTGRGSVFRIRLPLLDKPLPAPAKKKTAGEKNRKTYRILLAEDNEDLAFLLKKQFERKGHTVVAVIPNGADVLKAVATHQPESIVMDIGLPGKDGYEIGEELAGLPFRKDIRVIAMSGYSPDPNKEQLFDKFLLKPIQVNHLLSVLSE